MKISKVLTYKSIEWHGSMNCNIIGYTTLKVQIHCSQELLKTEERFGCSMLHLLLDQTRNATQYRLADLTYTVIRCNWATLIVRGGLNCHHLPFLSFLMGPSVLNSSLVIQNRTKKNFWKTMIFKPPTAP